MENYKRYLTESGHPIRCVSLAMQIESLSNALKDIVERLNGVDAYKIRDIRTIAECALIPYNQQDKE